MKTTPITKTSMMAARDAGIEEVTLRKCRYSFDWEDDHVVFVQASNSKGESLWSAGTYVDEWETIGDTLRMARIIWSETY